MAAPYRKRRREKNQLSQWVANRDFGDEFERQRRLKGLAAKDIVFRLGNLGSLPVEHPYDGNPRYGRGANWGNPMPMQCCQDYLYKLLRCERSPSLRMVNMLCEAMDLRPDERVLLHRAAASTAGYEIGDWRDGRSDHSAV